MPTSKSLYAQALKNRRNGVPSLLGPEASFVEIRPDFYADSRILSEDALEVLRSFRTTHPPYGLLDRHGDPVTKIKGSGRTPLMILTSALRTTAHGAMDEAEPSLEACPYHEVLAKKLGGTAIPLKPFDNNERGLDTLRDVVTPGAELNSPLFVSLVARLPSIQKLHGDEADPEGFARRSVSLLAEPLAHPQQWAKGFVYSLGSLVELCSPRFLNDDLARVYTKTEKDPIGQSRLAWAIPTEDFILRQEVDVVSRVRGSELDEFGSHVMSYPEGTRLGDIEVDEPTIGCPGDRFAREIWSRTVDAMAGEDLWGLER